MKKALEVLKRNLFLVVITTVMGVAATITSLTPLPDGGGVFTDYNARTINTNITNTNSNFSNVNAALAAASGGGGFTFSDSLTAHAGGNQTSALLLISAINRVTTVASPGDSVKLPLATGGQVVAIINDTSTSLQAYGSGTDTINDVATATGVAVPPNSLSFFNSTTAAPAGKWYLNPSSVVFGKTFIVNNTLTFSGTDGTTMTFPGVSVSLIGGSLVDCATTAACPSTAQTTLHTVVLRGTLSSGSPSTYAVTTISPAFTSSTSYVCTAQDTTTIANNIGVLTAGYVSGSAVTFTGPNTNTDTFRAVCTGY